MFSEGREDVNDEERAGRPSTSTTDEKINEVEKMILANRRITVREVAEDLNISIGSCHSIFINDLGMRRVAAKFVPKLLNCDQKQHRMNIANEMLDSVLDDPNLLQRVITGDEVWVYGYDVETKAQSSQWKLPHEPRPKKARQVRSNVKVLLTVFFDCRGVVHHEFLPQGRTVNKEYYLQVMRNLREAIRQKRPDLWKNKNWLLHHDNVPAHTSLLVRDFLAKNNTLMMPQPPYSPDLAPLTKRGFGTFEKINMHEVLAASEKLSIALGELVLRLTSYTCPQGLVSPAPSPLGLAALRDNVLVQGFLDRNSGLDLADVRRERAALPSPSPVQPHTGPRPKFTRDGPRSYDVKVRSTVLEVSDFPRVPTLLRNSPPICRTHPSIQVRHISSGHIVHSSNNLCHRKRRQFKQTDAFTRGMVIGLKRAGWSIRQIAADTHLGASTVHRLWRRWLEQGNVAIYRNVGATRVTSARVDRRILRQAVAAPQATCTAILQHVQDTLDHSISTRTISRRLVANGLHSCRPLRRLPLTPPNRRQRLEWYRARSTWMTEWHRVVFSDESRFCLSSDSRRVRVWRRRGERSNPAAIVERPTVRQRGIMVWGAIAYDSRSPLLRIQGTMTAQRYVDNVLRPVTLPYLQGVPNALYQQDNPRPHTARISQQALQDDIIGRRLHALPQPRSEDELWQMVEREWRAIPQDAIRTLIDSLPRRVAACIAVRGGPTCY
ncbi:hypothetical protein LAZ67_18001526 [Cordylochernes scorpioides]|uniref:Transposase Tc1-like domain-containing protein n=1 Tax=Cordylochernes scorpioides TaxID=51811 RepID=A0ABY6LFT0_9ARAC|nr:hypothetical protein LAZ67_18001526 [Cordylochernes scorpioides]